MAQKTNDTFKVTAVSIKTPQNKSTLTHADTAQVIGIMLKGGVTTVITSVPSPAAGGTTNAQLQTSDGYIIEIQRNFTDFLTDCSATDASGS
jgi:hypothetical protein